jgi:hypothetical protein
VDLELLGFLESRDAERELAKAEKEKPKEDDDE